MVLFNTAKPAIEAIITRLSCNRSLLFRTEIKTDPIFIKNPTVTNANINFHAASKQPTSLHLKFVENLAIAISDLVVILSDTVSSIHKQKLIKFSVVLGRDTWDFESL